MTTTEGLTKLTPAHLSRKAVVYLRQSSLAQVRDNRESQRLQYALKDTAKDYGFTHVETIDCDLGARGPGTRLSSGLAVTEPQQKPNVDAQSIRLHR
jgi:hypothetical protein